MFFYSTKTNITIFICTTSYCLIRNNKLCNNDGEDDAIILAQTYSCICQQKPFAAYRHLFKYFTFLGTSYLPQTLSRLASFKYGLVGGILTKLTLVFYNGLMLNIIIRYIVHLMFFLN